MATHLSKVKRQCLSGAAVALVLAGCAGVPLPREQLSDPGALLYNGYTKPKVNCFICHNGDGKGARGPALVSKMTRLSEEKVVRVIRDARGFMPEFGSKMTDEEIVQVARWIKSTFQ